MKTWKLLTEVDFIDIHTGWQTHASRTHKHVFSANRSRPLRTLQNPSTMAYTKSRSAVPNTANPLCDMSESLGPSGKEHDCQCSPAAARQLPPLFPEACAGANAGVPVCTMWRPTCIVVTTNSHVYGKQKDIDREEGGISSDYFTTNPLSIPD